MCSISAKCTSFLFKLDLHCNLPHFRNVSNTIGEKGGRTTEFICKCQFNKRQWNIIPFERETFLINFVLFPLSKGQHNCGKKLGLSWDHEFSIQTFAAYNPILDTSISILCSLVLLMLIPWILKWDGLEPSGQRLISPMAKLRD